jgi:hypothetical protein
MARLTSPTFGIIERDFTAGDPAVSETINDFMVLPAGSLPVFLSVEVLIAGDNGTNSDVALGPSAYDTASVDVGSNGSVNPAGTVKVTPGVTNSTLPPGGVFSLPWVFTAGATPGATAMSARGKVFYLAGSGV